MFSSLIPWASSISCNLLGVRASATALRPCRRERARHAFVHPPVAPKYAVLWEFILRGEESSLFEDVWNQKLWKRRP
jgi:hypothetical protein